MIDEVGTLGTDFISVSASDGTYVTADTFSFSVISFDSAFITTWNIAAPNTSITISTQGGTTITDYDFSVDWGRWHSF